LAIACCSAIACAAWELAISAARRAAASASCWRRLRSACASATAASRFA